MSEAYGDCFGCGEPCGIRAYCFGCRAHICEQCARGGPDSYWGPPKGHLPGFHLRADVKPGIPCFEGQVQDQFK